MKIFTAIQTQWRDFRDAVSKYLSSVLGKDGNYGPSNIFGQLITILNGAVQNMMLYIEDAFTEQNVHTAERKKSIYSLARLSGYEPHLGSASKCSIKLVHNSKAGTNWSDSSVVNMVNRTKIISNQNGLIYNIILPQESYAFTFDKYDASKHITAVEGTFETREYISTGGQLYSINVLFNGDTDLEYFTVTVNGEKWEKAASLYDMLPDGKEYMLITSLDKGVDVIFGNGQYGKILHAGDVINVEYLIHNGESGNIDPDDDITFTFVTSLVNTKGEEVDGNSIFDVELEDRAGITSGTYSETVSQVRDMIGYNSRALVLTEPKNYKLFLNRFSFVGYNRCWSEPGSLVVNALIMKNFNHLCENGIDYFSLNESDFMLSADQKESIKKAVVESKQQIAGTVLKFADPELKKYAVFIHLRMKEDKTYDREIIDSSIRNMLGEFFANVKSDIYIPKSDIVKLIKDNIDAVDGVNVYFISEENELAKINKQYTDVRYVYNPSTMTYRIIKTFIEVPEGTDPHVGMDEHGNILLENNMYFPWLCGGWKYYDKTIEGETIMINDPVNIIFN